jgi:hypothetical protein
MSAFPNGSASAATRTLRCPAWLAFPHVDHESDDAARGHVIHRYGKAVLSGTPIDAALAAVKDPAIRATCQAIDWQRVGGDLRNVQCEVAYVLDVRERTARIVGIDIGRNYEKDGPLGEWDVPGSVDIEGWADPRRLVVDDLKTGFLDVESAATNGQGLCLASAVSLAHGVSEVEFRISHLKPSGRVWNDAAIHTAMDIDGFLDEYEEAIVRSREAKRIYLAGGTPNVTEGDWCRYCPSADSCPAKTKLVRALLPELEAVDAGIDSLTPERAGQAWVLAHDRAAPLLERILDALKDRARRSPIPLGNGKELRESISARESLHAESILALARKLGATDEMIADCYREASVSRVIVGNVAGVRKSRKAA